MKKETKPLYIIAFTFVIFIFINGFKCGNMMIDFSRESYIPYQMLNGSVLIKDIFLIYGSFGYILNFLIYKLFGVNFNFLIYESIFISFCFVFLFYFISRQYLKRTEAVVLSLGAIAINIFSFSAFNFILPYSYSTLWGYFGSYLALFLLLKKKYSLLYIVLGFILINKIELGIILFIISLILNLNNKFKIKNIAGVLVFPVLNLLYFIHYNITLKDILYNASYIKSMLKTHALNYFYSHMGVYYNNTYFLYSLKKLALFVLVALVSYLLYSKNKKILSVFALIVGFGFFLSTKTTNLLTILLLYPLGFLLFKKKKIKRKEIALLCFTVALSLKAIFAINYVNYTNFAFGLCFLAICVFYKKIIPFKNRSWLMLISTILILFLFKDNLCAKAIKTPIKTNRGIILSEDKYTTKKIIDFLNRNLRKNENFIVIPEGQIFNLMYEKPYPYYYSTFTPLDFETFKEERIIKDLAKNKPDYIIFYPRNTKEYGASTICYDYAVNFCTYIMENYYRVDIIEGQYKTLIFKKK